MWKQTITLSINVLVKVAKKKNGGDRTKRNGFVLREGRFRLDIRKKSFTVKVVRHWNRLCSDVVDALSLETLKMRLDQALGDVV